jgi:hypothetical protein
VEQQNYWQSIQPFLEEIWEAYLVEGNVWHPDGFAGVVDALVNYDGNFGFVIGKLPPNSNGGIGFKTTASR